MTILVSLGCTDTSLEGVGSSKPATIANVKSKIDIPDQRPFDGDVSVSFSPTLLVDNRVHINGDTNLPTGTSLILTVREVVPDGFEGQSRCSVLRDGSFQSEAFGQRDGLKEGAYIAEVTMPIPQTQPSHVRAVIGEKGEKLTGSLVETGELGVTVSVEHEFTIGGELAVQAQQERNEARIRACREWHDKLILLRNRLRTARAKNRMRSKDDLKGVERWGGVARKFRKDIQNERDKLPSIESNRIRLAVAELLGHVSAMFDATAFQKPDDFKDASVRFNESLAELKKLIDTL